jgi:trk system potassium uptake protein TrkH
MKKWNITIRYAGFSLIGVSLLMFLSAFIAYINDMDDSFDLLVLSAMATLLSGFFAIIATKPQENMSTEEGFCIVTANLYFSGYYSTFPKALRMAAFQVCSLSTTTGFATADTNIWPSGSMGILLLCSLVCGCSGSTSGGMKMDRFVIVIKSLRGMINSLIEANVFNRTKLDGQVKTEANITSIITFMGIYALIIVIGTIIFAISMDFKTSLTASIACMGSVGPGFGDVGSMGNYDGMMGFQKVAAMFIMLLGRVEIYPMLIAIRCVFHR